MIQTVGGVDDLEAPELGTWLYVRHLIDQTVLIAGRTGECFKRRDGKRWPDAGYHITTNEEGLVNRGIPRPSRRTRTNARAKRSCRRATNDADQCEGVHVGD